MSLRALARFCYSHRKLVVLAWLVALVGMNALSSGIGPNYTTNFTAPNTESTRAQNLLAAHFKAQSGDTVQVALEGTPSMRDASVRAEVESFRAALTWPEWHVVEACGALLSAAFMAAAARRIAPLL